VKALGKTKARELAENKILFPPHDASALRGKPYADGEDTQPASGGGAAAAGKEGGAVVAAAAAASGEDTLPTHEFGL
jgi:hypothetical protein